MIKKVGVFFLFLLICFITASVVEGQTTAAISTEPVEIRATIVKVYGGVRIKSRGTILWHDAKVNEALSAGDQIETKEDGKIEIWLENENVINLKPNSKLTLQRLSRDLKTADYENLLESSVGKVRAKVEKIKGNSRFEIRTPTAIAAVRGTTMYLDILPNVTGVFFEGGTGTLTNIFSNIGKNVADGQTSSSDDKGDISEPKEASEEERSKWQEEWEPQGAAEGYSEPGVGGENLGSETDDLQENLQDLQNEAQNDKINSQPAELTAFVGSPLLVGGTPTDPTLTAPATETGTGSSSVEIDTDGDGIPDSIDTDDDNDGYTDSDENDNGSDPLLASSTPPDNDGDNVSDLNDTDDDNDTYADANDAFPFDPTEWLDTDGDLIGNNSDTDDDDDTMTDDYEIANGLDPLFNDSGQDKDGDGLTNLQEFNLRTYANDGDSDSDGLLDGNEVNFWQTNPLAADADNDGDRIPDIEDAFANSADLDSTNPDVYGSRDRIRNRLKDIMKSELEVLREDLRAMIEDTQIRLLDADMARIADAQTGKVLTDRQGNRVRVEQYVLRPRSDTVEVLNVNLRTGGDFAGLSTLDWKTRFGQNLDGLTGAELRALPWNDYLEAPATGSDLVGWGPEYDGLPLYFPTSMSVELKNPSGNSFYEERALNNPETKPLWDGKYRQNVTRDRLRINGGELKDFTINRSFSSGAGNPNGFKYNLAGGNEIMFQFYAIGDGEDTGRVAVSNKNLNNMWEALAVNMDGTLNRMNIGSNNLEIRISGASYSQDIDLIYVPFSRLDWNDSHHW